VHTPLEKVLPALAPQLVPAFREEVADKTEMTCLWATIRSFSGLLDSATYHVDGRRGFWAARIGHGTGRAVLSGDEFLVLHRTLPTGQMSEMAILQQSAVIASLTWGL
jgi:hypothetical protein